MAHSPTAKSNETVFHALITSLAATSHGSKELGAIKDFLKTNLPKTAVRKEFLLPLLIREAILWEEIKEAVWANPEDQEASHFPFLQGDIIGTTTVLALGSAESTQTHDLWMVLSPDCDCMRAPYIRVAPVFSLHSGELADNHRTQRFNYALQLATHKAFPLPCLPGDIEETLLGYFADLEVPYYLTDQYKNLATPYASLTINGWHLLNGLLQEKETRAANFQEAVAIRTIASR